MTDSPSIPQSPIERVRLLDAYGFKHFESILQLCKSDELMMSAISDQDFCLIFNCLTDARSRFDAEEVARLIRLADKYLATGRSLERIFELFFQQVAESAEFFPDLNLCEYFLSELKKYLNRLENFGVQMTDDEIVLDGWEVTAENKQLNVRLFARLSPLFNAIRIEHFPITESDFDQIQSTLHGKSSVAFEDCPFLLETKYFNFQHLTNLTDFQFSNCYCKHLLQMLKTISNKHLTHLDLSDTIFDEDEAGVLISILKEMPLESLDVSYYSSYKHGSPKFTAAVFHLSTLKSLALHGNLDAESFNEQLPQLKVLKLEYLDLSNNLGVDVELFTSNFSKFPALKKLNLSGMYLKEESQIYRHIHELKALQELTIDCIYQEDFEYLEATIQKYHLPLKFDFPSYYFSPDSISQIQYSKIINLYSILNDSLITGPFPEQFEALDLFVQLFLFYDPLPAVTNDFFSRFKKLKKLKIHLCRAANLEYFKTLLDNSSIEDLKIEIWDEFTKFSDLTCILKNRYFEIFKITFRKENKKSNSFLRDLVKIEMWERLGALRLNCSVQSAIFVLQNAKFKSLHTLCLKLHSWHEFTISTILPSVRIISVIFKRQQIPPFFSSSLSNFAKLCPRVAELEIYASNRSISPLDISLFANLRVLEIICLELQEPADLIAQLFDFSFLTRFVLIEAKKNETRKQLIYGKHLNFPTLTYSRLTSSKKVKNQFDLDSVETSRTRSKGDHPNHSLEKVLEWS